LHQASWKAVTCCWLRGMPCLCRLEDQKQLHSAAEAASLQKVEDLLKADEAAPKVCAATEHTQRLKHIFI
jgi:hypothetical protein